MAKVNPPTLDREAHGLWSQSHHEKPPEVTCTSRGNPGFPASTRQRPRETFFNTSRGQIPLPWLGSNDALPIATRMETRLPWRPVSRAEGSKHRPGLDLGFGGRQADVCRRGKVMIVR